jgi:hypothetical protein
MADTKHESYAGYSPDMDGPTHETTYNGFIRFAEIGTAFVICIVLALAVGGIKHAWLSAVLGIVLAHVTTALGLYSPKVGWRATAGVGALLILMLLLY